mmetsp:Transcript_23544/g.64063  ORF Transcript_23544/g.64063 Transcript_23544/m.64063 type:complete len:202 (+) Transcript_23544:677-1282(+)
MQTRSSPTWRAPTAPAARQLIRSRGYSWLASRRRVLRRACRSCTACSTPCMGRPTPCCTSRRSSCTCPRTLSWPRCCCWSRRASASRTSWSRPTAGGCSACSAPSSSPASCSSCGATTPSHGGIVWTTSIRRPLVGPSYSSIWSCLACTRSTCEARTLRSATAAMGRSTAVGASRMGPGSWRSPWRRSCRRRSWPPTSGSS